MVVVHNIILHDAFTYNYINREFHCDSVPIHILFYACSLHAFYFILFYNIFM